MVDKDDKAAREARIAYALKLRAAIGKRNADIAREVSRKRGNNVHVTPQAVGKWWKDGAISGPNLLVLQALAGVEAVAPPSRAQRIAQAINSPDQPDEKGVARLRQDITVLRKAVVILALAVSERTPGVAGAFAEYLKATVPDEYYGERGFHVLLEAGLPLADEIAAEEPSSSPVPQARQSTRKARR